MTDALHVQCPLCERKPGYPCQRLSGRVAWMPDPKRGGIMGMPDQATPHHEREVAAR